MKIRILAVGKLSDSFFKEAFENYAKRLSRFCTLTVTEIPESKKDDVISAVREEGEELSSKTSGYVIVLDKSGQEIASEEFSNLMKKQFVSGISEITFVIGGSYGLSEKAKNCGNFLLSFGKFTYPHQLMRVILAEQIYRAFTIMENITYHK